MAAAEIVATISTLAGIGSKLAETVRSLREAKALTPEATKAVAEAQELVLSLQARLLQAQEQALALQDENRELRAQVRQYEERTTEREKYERRKMGGATVVVARDDPETLLCATCYAKGKEVFLDRLSGPFAVMGTHRCPSCDSFLTLPE